MEFLGVFGTVALAFSVCFGFYLAGLRVKQGQVQTWKDNYDADHTRAERLQATLVEKDLLMAGMSERLSRLDEVVQELGGQKVYQEMIAMQERNLTLFQEITHAIQDGDAKITDAIKDLTHTVEKAANGHG